MSLETHRREERSDEHEENVVEEETGEQDGANLEVGESYHLEHVNAAKNMNRKSYHLEHVNAAKKHE